MRVLLTVILMGCGTRTPLTDGVSGSATLTCDGDRGTERVLLARNAVEYSSVLLVDGDHLYFDSPKTGVSRLSMRTGTTELLAPSPAIHPALGSALVAWTAADRPTRVAFIARDKRVAGARPLAGPFDSMARLQSLAGTSDDTFYAGFGDPDPSRFDSAHRGLFELRGGGHRQLSNGNVFAIVANDSYVAFVEDLKLRRLTRRSGVIETFDTSYNGAPIALAGEEILFGASEIRAIGSARGERLLATLTGQSIRATDDSYAYLTRGDDGIQRLPLAGGPVEILARDRFVAIRMAVDRCAVYWSSERGVVRYVK